jgi:hypothetical protein
MLSPLFHRLLIRKIAWEHRKKGLYRLPKNYELNAVEIGEQIEELQGVLFLIQKN